MVESTLENDILAKEIMFADEPLENLVVLAVKAGNNYGAFVQVLGTLVDDRLNAIPAENHGLVSSLLHGHSTLKKYFGDTSYDIYFKRSDRVIL